MSILGGLDIKERLNASVYDKLHNEAGPTKKHDASYDKPRIGADLLEHTEPR